jgi:hypothetical protein
LDSIRNRQSAITRAAVAAHGGDENGAYRLPPSIMEYPDLARSIVRKELRRANRRAAAWLSLFFAR